jgi:hypothetical protein
VASNDTGIIWDRNSGRWSARISHEQREFHLGSSKKKEVVVPLRHIAESFLYKKQVGTVQMSMTEDMFDLINQDQANEQYWSTGVGTEEQLDCMKELCGKLQAVAKKANEANEETQNDEWRRKQGDDEPRRRHVDLANQCGRQWLARGDVGWPGWTGEVCRCCDHWHRKQGDDEPRRRHVDLANQCGRQ